METIGAMDTISSRDAVDASSRMQSGAQCGVSTLKLIRVDPVNTINDMATKRSLPRRQTINTCAVNKSYKFANITAVYINCTLSLVYHFYKLLYVALMHSECTRNALGTHSEHCFDEQGL